VTAGGALRSLGAGLAGFVVYGGWAYWANLGHGQAMGMRAGLLQGGYSFALTFFSTLMMEWLYRRCAGHAHARLLTIAATGAILLAVPATLHMLAGTPEILMTVAPGFAIGMVYTTVYVTALARVEALSEPLRERP
jgi:hypothetical protein